MDTDSLYLALSEENLEDVILPENELNGTSYVLKIALIVLLRMQLTCFSPELAVMGTRNKIRETGLFKEELRCAEILCSCRKTSCCYDRKSNKYKFSSKGLNKRTLKDHGDGPMSKYRKVLQEAVNVTSTNRRFRTIQHSVATYEQRKDCLTFIQKE